MKKALDVYQFVDYRAFLRAYYEQGKTLRGLSYRGFSRRAGFKSPNFVKLVMDGERNLGGDAAPRVAKACGLEGEAAEYFCALVGFNQSEGLEARRSAYEGLQRFQRYRRVHALTFANDAYHANWYIPAIRELVASPVFREEAAWIARRMRPRITAKEARAALRTLRVLGLIKRNEEGKLVQTDALISGTPGPGGDVVRRFHRAMLVRASEAFDHVAYEHRDISGMTVCVDVEGIQRLKKRLAEIRSQLFLEAEAMAQGPRTVVVQIGIQLVPLTAVEAT